MNESEYRFFVFLSFHIRDTIWHLEHILFIIFNFQETNVRYLFLAYWRIRMSIKSDVMKPIFGEIYYSCPPRLVWRICIVSVVTYYTTNVFKSLNNSQENPYQMFSYIFKFLSNLVWYGKYGNMWKILEILLKILNSFPRSIWCIKTVNSFQTSSFCANRDVLCNLSFN